MAPHHARNQQQFFATSSFFIQYVCPGQRWLLLLLLVVHICALSDREPQHTEKTPSNKTNKESVIGAGFVPQSPSHFALCDFLRKEEHANVHDS